MILFVKRFETKKQPTKSLVLVKCQRNSLLSSIVMVVSTTQNEFMVQKPSVNHLFSWVPVSTMLLSMLSIKLDKKRRHGFARLENDLYQMSHNSLNLDAWAKPKKLPNDMVPKVGMNAPLTCVRIFNALNDDAENEKEAAYILYQNWFQPISNESL